MDDRGFDRLTRALAMAGSRRHALVGALAIGVTALVGARRSEAQEPTPLPDGVGTTLCAGEGQPCVMLTGCCSGFTCVTSSINPNQGFCQSGGTGGVQIAPPLVGGAGDGASEQAAPTRTPRPRKTHTPGNNNNNNTNTSNRPANELKVTSIDCYLNSNSTVPHVTVRNTGTEPVVLGNIKTIKNPDFNGQKPGDDPLDITSDGRLKPSRSITYVLQDQTFSGGKVSGVALPANFFSNERGEGVIVTYESVGGTSFTTPAKTCPDSAPAAVAAEKSSKVRRKKNRRK